jgi:hypothetical protein
MAWAGYGRARSSEESGQPDDGEKSVDAQEASHTERTGHGREIFPEECRTSGYFLMKMTSGAIGKTHNATRLETATRCMV